MTFWDLGTEGMLGNKYHMAWSMWKPLPYVSATKTKKSQATFLGMKILSSPDGIWTSVQPKGDGWAWLPQKFIEYSSCHTHYTKWYMLKGLLIRAMTICNNQKDFMHAAMYYTQGLIARDFPQNTIMRAWGKFVYEKVTHPAARHHLTNQFKQWLGQQDFSAAHDDESIRRRKRLEKTRAKFVGTLMCGLTATNHILRSLNLPPVSAEFMQEQAALMAEKEDRLLHSSSPDAVHDLAIDPRGN